MRTSHSFKTASALKSKQLFGSTGLLNANPGLPLPGQQVGSLLFCILMDLIGFATYSIPFLGEFGDLVWAPISAVIFYKTFGGWKGAFGGIFNFVEEILPFTDFIPSFTVMWVMRSLKVFAPRMQAR